MHASFHWLSPLNEAELTDLLNASDYARQINDGDAVLIGYNGHGPYDINESIGSASGSTISFYY